MKETTVVVCPHCRAAIAMEVGIAVLVRPINVPRITWRACEDGTKLYYVDGSFAGSKLAVVKAVREAGFVDLFPSQILSLIDSAVNE